MLIQNHSLASSFSVKTQVLVMAFKFHIALAFLVAAIVVSCDGAVVSPSEKYWKSVLPDSPMPQAVKDLLLTPTEWAESKSTSVGVSKGGGVNVNTGKGKTGGTTVNVGHGRVGVHTGKGKHGGTNVNVGHGGVGVHTGKPGKRTNVGVGKGGVTVTTPKKGHPVYVGPFKYLYAATETQLHDNPNVALFFLEKDMHSGTEMKLQFSKTENQATFLPRQVAGSLPFSSKRFPEILSRFNPTSEEADVMKKTIKECEDAGIKGEEKFCATSLESMIDFSTSKLGRNVEAISTNAQAKGENSSPKQYSVVEVTKMPSDKAVVVCHRLEYAYAVFYCHKTEKTAAYEVSLVAADGSKAQAVAVCHRDTAQWNPKHLAFQVLKVQPGSVPVCHFLPQDHIVWVPKY